MVAAARRHSGRKRQWHIQHEQTLRPIRVSLSSLYWLVFAATLGWILLYAVQAMLVLHRDPRSRLIATFYLAASFTGIAALGVVAAHAVAPR